MIIIFNKININDYKIKDIWNKRVFSILNNKKIQIAFMISVYSIALLTNLFVILVILIIDNSDLFKGFKQ